MALYSFASGLLFACFLFTLLAALLVLFQLFRLQSRTGPDAALPAFMGKNGTLPSFAVSLALFFTLLSAILLYAFITHDFIVEYVAQYSDRTLPLFYRMTAFWAGQSGSMLFWAWSVALSGACFMLLPAYKNLGRQTRLWFALFFFCIMAFFLLVLSIWSNPFDTLEFTPRDGRGLNPLLQNPGMIFHPPLLFLGYGGFVVPGCLALAQALSGRLRAPSGGERLEEAWGQASRPFILTAWALLTAGIVLGAWWAYMELGWGGYWAWDPVENASLIPWLIATAYLHTAVIGSRRDKLQRTNVFLMALTTISAFFATYLVRSGVVESLHAFGDGGVGTPLLIFTFSFLYFAAAVVLCEPGAERKGPSAKIGLAVQGVALLSFCALLVFAFIGTGVPAALILFFSATLLLLLFLYHSPNSNVRHLEGLSSKEGLLLLVAWLLLAVSFIILVATMWPVIVNALLKISGYLPEALGSRLPQQPMGLDAAFYNRTCLPLFSLLAVLLLLCPWRKWKSLPGLQGFSKPVFFGFALAVCVCAGILLWIMSVRQPVALMAAACSLAGIYGICLYFIGNRGMLAVRSTVAAHGVHIGLLLMVLGVALSGPYQQKYTVELSRQERRPVGDYIVVLNELYEGESQIGPSGRPNFQFVEAELLILNDKGKMVGRLSPQRRLYANFENQVFAEVDTIFSLGNEIYATLLGVNESGRATLAVNVNPLVNWLWIGGTIMCLLPFFSLARVRREDEDAVADAGATV